MLIFAVIGRARQRAGRAWEPGFFDPDRNLSPETDPDPDEPLPSAGHRS